jgi:hypothetical protein
VGRDVVPLGHIIPIPSKPGKKNQVKYSVKFRSQIEKQVSNYRLLRASTVDIGGIVDHCCLNFHFIIAVNWLEYFLNGSRQMFFPCQMEIYKMTPT